MATTPPANASNTLAIDPEDDAWVVTAIEQAFGIRFDRKAIWTTVGDLYDELVALVPPSVQPGKCSTAMAFYRVRRAIREVSNPSVDITPSTRFRDLSPRPTMLLRKIADDIGLPVPRSALGSTGLLGCGFMLGGLLGGLASAAVHALWPAWLLIPAGIVLMRLDSGRLATATVGEVARAFSIQNHGALADQGADRRPEAMWNVLIAILAEYAGATPGEVNRETRLLV